MDTLPLYTDYLAGLKQDWKFVLNYLLNKAETADGFKPFLLLLTDLNYCTVIFFTAVNSPVCS